MEEELCVNTAHTHTAECGQSQIQTPNAGETVVDEQVEQAACVRVGRKLCPLHDNIITWQREPFTASCSYKQHTPAPVNIKVRSLP